MTTTIERLKIEQSNKLQIENIESKLNDLVIKIHSMSLNESTYLRQERNSLEIRLYCLKTRFKKRTHIAESSNYYILK